MARLVSCFTLFIKLGITILQTEKNRLYPDEIAGNMWNKFSANITYEKGITVRMK